MAVQRRYLFLASLALLLFGIWWDRQKTPIADNAAVVDLAPKNSNENKPGEVQQVPTAGLNSAEARKSKEATAQKDFQNQIDTVSKNLPSQKTLQQLPAEQAHFTPEVIQQAALDIGQIAQAIADNAALRPQGLQFYQGCAENEDYPNSVRAACFANHEEIIRQSGPSEKSLEADSKIPAHIKALAKKF